MMLRPFVYAYSLAVAVALVASCGGTAGDKANGTLDAITAVSDPLYGGAVRGCYSLERAVVEREGTTAAEDAAELAKIRQKCDIIFAQFERLIRLQVAAREAIDGFEAGEGTKEDVEVAIGAASALLEEIKVLLGEVL